MGKRAFGAGLTLAMILGGSGVAAKCQADQLSIRGDWGNARFSVEIADTVETRNRGLMFRESMPRFTGMLFVYDAPRPVSFWMKNTLIPLDMIFLDAAGVVQSVHANAIPGDLTPIPGGSDIQFVFEINGGMAAILGISKGSEMQHLAVPANNAAWPCKKDN